MNKAFERTRLLVGEQAIEKLNNARVAVFGIGGVGGHLAEALARSSVGYIDLYDNDVVSETNLNRQIVALRSTIGKYKTEVMKERILDINPECNVNAFNLFYESANANTIDLSKYNYIADAIDSVKSKIELIVRANDLNVPIISAMGAGNKMNPTQFEVADIFKTSVCPLARIMRKELKSRGVSHLKVCYTKEDPIVPLLSTEDKGGKLTPGSNAFCPSVMGLVMASEVVKDLIKF